MKSFFDKLKSTNNLFYIIMGILFIVITAGINIFGFYNLPDTIATQFNLAGSSSVNHMGKAYYLALTSVLVLLFTVLFLHSEQERKLKYFVADCLFVVANFIMIVIQV